MSFQKVLWNISSFVGCWKIWLKCNNRVFNSNSRAVSEVVDSFVWSVSMWASRDKTFHDVSMFDLNLSWEAYFYEAVIILCILFCGIILLLEY